MGKIGRPAVNTDKCASRACDRPARTKGYCTGHYYRALHGKDVHTPLRKMTYTGQVKCIEPGCVTDKAYRGYCLAHWARKTGRVDPSLPIRWRRKPGDIDTCHVPGCIQSANGRWCNSHRVLKRKAETLGLPDSYWKRRLKPRAPNGWVIIDRVRLKPNIRDKVTAYAEAIGKPRSVVVGEALEEWWREIGRRRMRGSEDEEEVTSDAWARRGDSMEDAA